jgi:hypothetical protein
LARVVTKSHDGSETKKHTPHACYYTGKNAILHDEMVTLVQRFHDEFLHKSSGKNAKN